jgi:hypothetical protein
MPWASRGAAWDRRSPRRDSSIPLPSSPLSSRSSPLPKGIENVAFNDFTLGVDTTALVQAENIYEVSDAFSASQASMGSRLGGEIHANQINTHPDVVFNGSFAFNGSETGLDFADFLLGVASSYTQGQAQQLLQPQSVHGGLRAGQLEGRPDGLPELRRALG